MRGTDHQQAGMYSYLSPEVRVRPDHPLRAIRAMSDKALCQMSARFDEMYAKTGRPSIAPEKLLRAQLIQMLYTVRSERLLMEEIDYSVLFRWFIGMNLDEPVWDVTVFTKNRNRLLEGDVAREFLSQVLNQAREENDRQPSRVTQYNAGLSKLLRWPGTARSLKRNCPIRLSKIRSHHSCEEFRAIREEHSSRGYCA